MLKEFKEFAMKGNVLDMAIGVIMGGAFGKIVSSLVSDVLMPPDRPGLGRRRLHGFVYQSLRRRSAIACCCESRGGRDDQLRGVSPNHLRLHHHRICDLHVCQADEPV